MYYVIVTYTTSLKYAIFASDIKRTSIASVITTILCYRLCRCDYVIIHLFSSPRLVLIYPTYQYQCYAYYSRYYVRLHFCTSFCAFSFHIISARSNVRPCAVNQYSQSFVAHPIVNPRSVSIANGVFLHIGHGSTPHFLLFILYLLHFP